MRKLPRSFEDADCKRPTKRTGFRRWCQQCGVLTPSTMHAKEVLCNRCTQRRDAAIAVSAMKEDAGAEKIDTILELLHRKPTKHRVAHSNPLAQFRSVRMSF